MKRKFTSLSIFCMIIALSACGSDESFVDNIGKGNLSLTLQPSASVKDGVSGFNIEVTNALGPVVSRYVLLSTASLPSGFVPDAGSAHNFANTLFVLVPGSYHVKITPMRSSTESSTLCATAEADVVITSNATTTTTLISQCVDVNNGGLGVIAVLNNNPQILDLEFNPSQFVSTCQNLTVTMTAQDPDGDALTYDWEILGAPSGAANTNSIDLERDGGQYLSTADSASLSFVSDFTIEGWLKWESLPSVNDEGSGLFNKISLLTGTDGFHINHDKFPAGQVTKFGVGIGATNEMISYTWSSISIDVWYHLAFTRKGSTGEMKIYLNGVAVVSEIKAMGDMVDTNADLQIGGKDMTAYSGTFDGLMDEVRVWNVVRTQAEINANKSVMIDSAPGLVGSWHLSSSLADSSGNGNTLTNNGGATFVTDVPFAGGGSYTSSNVNNVFSFTGFASGTYNMQGTACDPFNLCSSITAPIYVSGPPCP